MTQRKLFSRFHAWVNWRNKKKTYLWNSIPNATSQLKLAVTVGLTEVKGLSTVKLDQQQLTCRYRCPAKLHSSLHTVETRLLEVGRIQSSASQERGEVDCHYTDHLLPLWADLTSATDRWWGRAGVAGGLSESIEWLQKKGGTVLGRWSWQGFHSAASALSLLFVSSQTQWADRLERHSQENKPLLYDFVNKIVQRVPTLCEYIHLIEYDMITWLCFGN